MEMKWSPYGSLGHVDHDVFVEAGGRYKTIEGATNSDVPYYKIAS